jgi:phosphoglycolate phosphatase-like HAD superfamily hydrolase
MTNNQRAVIFDLDGTLIDSMSSFSTMVIKNLKQRGINDIKELANKLEDELTNESRTIPSGSSITLIPKIFWKIGRKAGLSRYKALFFTIDCITKARDIYYNAPLFSDVKDSLFRLKSAGYSLGIYTLASRKQLNMTLTKHNIAHFFNPNSIISRNDVKKTKPDPEGVLLAFNGCSVYPHSGIYIGDMPADIKAGNSAGAITIGVTTGLFNSKTLNQLCQPHIIFESLGEASNWILDSFLKKMNLK